MSAPVAPALARPEMRGIALYLVAVFCFAMMDMVAKLLLERHDPIMVVWARYASQGFWAVLILSPQLLSVARTTQPGLQILRSILPFGATVFFFSSLQVMQLAEAVAIFEIAPLLITALAFLFLGEKIGPRRWAGVALGFLGALIIIRPGTEVFSLASLMPMAAALCFAGYAVATRLLNAGESPWTSFLWTAVIGAGLATLLLPFGWSTPSWKDALVMSVFGILGGVGQLLMIMALRHAPASVVAPFNYTGLVYSAFWGFVVFSELPDGWTWAGAAVIVSSGLYVWWRERVRASA